MDSARPVTLHRYRAGLLEPATDVVADEQLLGIRVNGVLVNTLLRTPGHDALLTLGFLLTDRIIDAPSEVLSLRHSSIEPSPAHEERLVEVRLQDAALGRFHRSRLSVTQSSCGLCGSPNLDALCERLPPRLPVPPLPALRLTHLIEGIRDHQPGFTLTGGLHAAALFDWEGQLEVGLEDIGRHNAVDKVIGFSAVNGRYPIGNRILLVSGRAGFDIVQKAAVAGIPVVAAVSAPSALAIQLADRAGITLVGFLRGDQFNVYSHPERLRL